MEVIVSHEGSERIAILARDGDPGALETLIRRYYRPVFTFVRRMVPRVEDARDITQDVFAGLVRGIQSYRPEYRFSTWLFRIALNRVVDNRRRFALPPLPPEKARTAEALSGREAAPDLDAALGALPEPLRIPLLLAFQQGLSHAEIAQILEITPNAVKCRIHDAVRFLRTRVRREDS